jgi:hypothetical protein
MTARLRILNGELKGSEFALHEGTNTIGRRSDNHVVAADATVSRYHAVLDQRNGSVVLRKVTNKGILKVDGREVESVNLQGEHRLQIGNIIFQYKQDAELTSGSALPVHQKRLFDDEQTVDLSVLEDEINANNLEARDSDEDDVQQRDAVKKFSAKGLVQILALLVLGFMAWMVLKSIKPEELDPIIFPYRAGEEKLIDLDGHFKRLKIKGHAADLNIDHPEVLRASLEAPPLRNLWFKSLKQGECTVTLVDRQKNPMIKFKFVIQGAVETRAEVFARENMPEAERLAEAQKLMDKGKLVSKENRSEAYKYFDQALLYLETISTSSPLYFECRRLMEEPKQALDERLKFLWKEANSSRKNKNYETALVYIQQILDLVKDPANMDHQRAQIHKKYILLILKK